MFVFIPGLIRSVRFGQAGTVRAEISIRAVTYTYNIHVSVKLVINPFFAQFTNSQIQPNPIPNQMRLFLWRTFLY